mmetsp:Transcript_110531/g.293629  ORF Transcript_110531/g.293629 Transcript_110531/m.293629 type:complete len:561 (-) Transcript_110531:104-1786(-)
MAVSAETDGCRVLVAASGHPAIQKDVTQELSTSVSNIPANATNSLQLISRRSSSGSRHGLDHHARLLHCNSEVSKEVLLPHSVQESRFSWVRTSFFEGVFAILILINSVVVVVETDHRHRNDGIGWVISDTIWTVIFLVEVVLRMLALKHLWPRSPWNIFDLLLVLVSITDAWLMPLIKSQFDLRALSVFRIARLFRMLRILRLLRLLRHFQKLVLLVQALWGAFRALIWFMILVAAVLYVFALVLTRLSSLDPYLRDNGLVQLWFGSMLRSLFTLFQLMTLEGWPDIARETLNEIPWLTTFYVCFIILTNITLLNIVAGVLTENVLSTARKEAARQLERKEKVLQAEREWVGEELASLDQNGDGMLDLHELQAAEASPQQAPHLAKFLQLASLKTQEAEDLFRLVDYDDAGVVSYKVFVEAARRARGPIKSKHFLHLKKDISRLGSQLDRVTSLLQKVSASVAALAGDTPSRPPSRRPTPRCCSAVEEESSVVPESADDPSQSSRFGVRAMEPMEVPGLTLEAPSDRSESVGIAELRRDFYAQLRGMESRLQGLLEPDA